MHQCMYNYFCLQDCKTDNHSCSPSSTWTLPWNCWCSRISKAKTCLNFCCCEQERLAGFAIYSLFTEWRVHLLDSIKDKGTFWSNWQRADQQEHHPWWLRLEVDIWWELVQVNQRFSWSGVAHSSLGSQSTPLFILLLDLHWKFMVNSVQKVKMAATNKPSRK